MKLGVIARADCGGLAAQSLDVVKWLRPDRVLVIDLGPGGRGTTDPEKAKAACPTAEVTLHETDESRFPPDPVMNRFLKGLDVCWSAETFYNPRTADLARAVGCRTVLHANPELMQWSFALPDAIWLPTVWEADRFPDDTPVVPVPVDRERFARRPAPTSLQRLFHIAAPAVWDRNGTRILLAALRHVTAEVSLAVRGSPTVLRSQNLGDERTIGGVVVTPLPEVDDHDEVWPDDIDAFAIPRSYGGNCMPAWEAAGLGLPIVTLDLPPLNEWVHPAGLVPAAKYRQRPMAGSYDERGHRQRFFQLHRAAPVAVARAIDRLADPDTLAASAEASATWADRMSWERQLPVWREALEKACR